MTNVDLCKNDPFIFCTLESFLKKTHSLQMLEQKPHYYVGPLQWKPQLEVTKVVCYYELSTLATLTLP
jgi:hypothetical protein